MKIHYGFILSVIAGLLWFTSVQVSALRQQPAGNASGATSRPAGTAQVQAELLAELSARDADRMLRLNRRLESNPMDHEAALLRSLLYFKAGRVGTALAQLEELAERAPLFHLAHLFRGDLLLAQFGQVKDIGETNLLKELVKKDESQLERLRLEAGARLKGYLSLVGDALVPSELINLSPQVKQAILVDKSRNRLYVFENAGPMLPPMLRSDFYIAYGKKEGNKVREGDLRTPEGVYRITSHIPDEKLPPMYGVGAYPINYPNELDRKLDKSGFGIWLHGTDREFYSRPPNDSEGCVVLTNEDLDRIEDGFQVGTTPVIIAERLEWVTPERWLEQSRKALEWVESWRADWENGNVERYLSRYARDFWGDGYDLRTWQERKRLVARGKKFQKVDLSRLSLLAYPAGAGLKGKRMMVAQFYQSYKSNNYNGDMWKKLYLVEEGRDWKILYEGGL